MVCRLGSDCIRHDFLQMKFAETALHDKLRSKNVRCGASHIWDLQVCEHPWSCEHFHSAGLGRGQTWSRGHRTHFEKERGDCVILGSSRWRSQSGPGFVIQISRVGLGFVCLFLNKTSRSKSTPGSHGRRKSLMKLMSSCYDPDLGGLNGLAIAFRIVPLAPGATDFGFPMDVRVSIRLVVAMVVSRRVEGTERGNARLGSFGDENTWRSFPFQCAHIPELPIWINQ